MADLVIREDKVILLEESHKEVRFHGHHVSVTNNDQVEAFPSGHFYAHPVEITMDGTILKDNPHFRNWLTEPFVKSYLDQVGSAASFEIDGIIIKERHFPSESKMMYKSASGCMEHINIFEVSNINTTLKFLREKNFWIYGFEASSEKKFNEIKWNGNNILLFGSEGFGMREHTKKYTDFSVKIDINKNIESLNISNSAAIVFHHINQYKNKT